MATNREHFAEFRAIAEQVMNGFDALKVVDLAISGSLTSGVAPGITGEYEGTFKKIKIVNGVITEFELEE